MVRAYDVPVRCDSDPLQSQSNIQIQVELNSLKGHNRALNLWVIMFRLQSHAVKYENKNKKYYMKHEPKIHKTKRNLVFA